MSQEAEEAGLTPKSPFLGYVGQFETDNEAWTNLTKVPVAFVQSDVVVDEAGSPLPQHHRALLVHAELPSLTR